MLAAAFNHFLCRLLNFQSNTLVPQNVKAGKKEGAVGGEGGEGVRDENILGTVSRKPKHCSF